MSLSSVQLFLEQAFDFLCDHQFNVEQTEWEKFCQEGQVTIAKLDTEKSNLLSKLDKSENDQKTELLQQLFCCDPFDKGIAKALQSAWHQKADIEPTPYQRWFSDLSIYLLELSAKSPNNAVLKASEISESNDQKKKTVDVKNAQADYFKAIIISGITVSISIVVMGFLIMIVLIINNVNNKQASKVPNISTPNPRILPQLKSKPNSQNMKEDSVHEPSIKPKQTRLSSIQENSKHHSANKKLLNTLNNLEKTSDTNASKNNYSSTSLRPNKKSTHSSSASNVTKHSSLNNSRNGYGKKQEIDDLADRIFYERHPGLRGRKINPSETSLSYEWNRIRQCEAVVDYVFYQNHPELGNRKIHRSEKRLIKEWLSIKRQKDKC